MRASLASRRVLVLAAAAIGALAAWALFSWLPPMRAQVGMETIDALVPAHYQAAAFPAFSAWLAILAVDLRARRPHRALAPRAAVLVATGLLAAIRLTGALPLSGHALFLAAAVAYDLAAPAPREREAALLAALGLGVTAYYKLAVWDDARWLALSLAAGASLGAVAALVARRASRRPGLLAPTNGSAGG